MNIWLEIFTEPKIAICYTKSYLPALDTDSIYPYLLNIGTLKAGLSLPNKNVGAANVSVTVINDNYRFTDLWKNNPPFQKLVHAKYVDKNGIAQTYFAGRIDSISMGEDITIGIVAPLVQKIPLRRTTAWSNYATDEALPIGFGTVTLKPRRYDRRGKLWHLVDGVADKLLSVNFRGEKYADAGLVNTKDETGAAVALMEVGNPSLDASDWEVTLRINNRTNPANVIYDLLLLSGESVNNLTVFENECYSQNIEIHGLVNAEHPTVRSQISEVLQSVCCGWSQAMQNVARLWPPVIRDDEPIRRSFNAINCIANAQADETEVVTELLVKYAFNWANGRHEKTILLRANESYDVYGYKPAELDARWVVNDRQAVELGKRWLQYYSSPIWRASIKTAGSNPILPGDLLSANIPGLPVSGELLITSVADNIQNSDLVVETEAAANVTNTIQLIGQSTVDDGLDVPLLINTDDDTIQVTALDKNGNPASGAVVTIANQSATADSNGRATFALSAGTYDVSIRYVDGTIRNLQNQSIGV